MKRSACTPGDGRSLSVITASLVPATQGQSPQDVPDQPNFERCISSLQATQSTQDVSRGVVGQRRHGHAFAHVALRVAPSPSPSCSSYFPPYPRTPHYPPPSRRRPNTPSFDEAQVHTAASIANPGSAVDISFAWPLRAAASSGLAYAPGTMELEPRDGLRTVVHRSVFLHATLAETM